LPIPGNKLAYSLHEPGNQSNIKSQHENVRGNIDKKLPDKRITTLGTATMTTIF
jgi:hypothetical protein